MDYYETWEKKPEPKPKPSVYVPWYEWILVPILVAALVAGLAMLVDPLMNQRRLYPEWFMPAPHDGKGDFIWSTINPWVIATFFMAAFYIAALVGVIIAWTRSTWFASLMWFGLFLCPPAEPNTNSNLLFTSGASGS